MSALEYHYNGSHQSKEIIESHNEQLENLEKIKKILNKSGNKYKIITRKELSGALVDDYDLIISAGGDGTVIATAAYNKDKPQLNLKTDKRSKGTLCNNIASLEDVMKINYSIEKWTRQDIYLDKELIGRALNETCIGENLKFSKMARYEMSFSHNRLFEFPFPEKNEICKNSGLVIVTGTGSTGWPSAFEPFPKNSNTLKYRAILPYQGKEKGQGSYFKIKYKGHEGKVAIDTVEYPLSRDSLLEVIESSNPLLAVIPKTK